MRVSWRSVLGSQELPDRERALHERPAHDLVDLARVLPEREIPTRVARTREALDRSPSAFDVGVEIELAAVREELAAQGVERHELERVRELRGAAEELFEDRAHREHRRAGRQLVAVDLDLAELTADAGAAFEQTHGEARTREVDGRGQAAHARTDDDGRTPFDHANRFSVRAGERIGEIV